MERLRVQLAQIIETAAAEAEAQRMAEQRLAAEAIEQANSSAAIKAAYNQGRHDDRREVLALIQEQRAMLSRGGVNAISLQTLEKRLQEA
jgi:hypothetical protein